MLARMTGGGDDFDIADDIAVADDSIGLIKHAARRDDPRACSALQRRRGRSMIGVTMRDQDRIELRHRVVDRVDVRIDRRPGIERDRLVDQIRPRAVQRERSGVRSSNAADQGHSGIVAQLHGGIGQSGGRVPMPR